MRGNDPRPRLRCVLRTEATLIETVKEIAHYLGRPMGISSWPWERTFTELSRTLFCPGRTRHTGFISTRASSIA